MKKITLLVCLVFMLPLFCRAQFNTYHPFPYNNAYWNEVTWMQYNTDIVYTHFDEYVDGDTIVNGKSYIKIRTSGGYKSHALGSDVYWSSYDDFECLLRDDTIAHKVYVSFPPDYGTDTLFYDFTAKQGQYVGWGLPVQDSCWVYAIDSVLVGNSYRKQLIIARSKSRPSIYDSIVEGIGSSEGLLAGITIPFESVGWLNCFDNYSENIVYPRGDSCQRYYLSVPKIKNQSAALTLYPNPGNGHYTFELNAPIAGTIEIYDVTGRMIYQTALQPEKTEINIDAQPAGIYFYRALTTAGSLIGEGKIVKE